LSGNRRGSEGEEKEIRRKISALDLIDRADGGVLHCALYGARTAEKRES